MEKIKELEQFIQDLNETWRSARYDDLYEYYHENVVMLPPGSNKPIEGIESMVESYRQFGSFGTIHGFDIADLNFYHYESVTICHMQFEVDYEIESGRFQESGLEIYVIDTSGPKPKIIWRSQVTLNADEA